MALITGRIQTLPPPDKNARSEDADPLDQPSIPNDQDLQPQIPNQATVSPHGEDEEPSSLLPEHDAINNGSQTTDNGGGNVPPPLHKFETSVEAIRVPASEVNGKVRSSLVSSVDQNPSASTVGSEPHVAQQTRGHKFFTSSQINSAIAASGKMRLLCSVTVALLVLLSHLGFPLPGTYIIKSVISFRPLYLLLLTNVTIVLAHLLSGKQRRFERAARVDNEATRLDGYGWAEQVSWGLEKGLVMQKAFDAMFMDCSIYVTIVICGLSVAHLFS